MNINEKEQLDILREINKKTTSQRKIAKDLGISLGKLNYCLKALKNKGLIKYKNFKKIRTNKIIYTFLPHKGSLQKRD